MEDSPTDSVDPLPPASGGGEDVDGEVGGTVLPTEETQALGGTAVRGRVGRVKDGAVSRRGGLPLPLQAAAAEMLHEFRNERMRTTRTA